MYILGISAFYHDSAACLIKDGLIISAAQEERFTRIKHDSSFPKNSINFCLKNSNINIDDIDYVSFYEKPYLKFDRLLKTYLSYSPIGLKSFITSMPLWVQEKLWMGNEIKNNLKFKGDIVYPEHHMSHSSSAFYPSPFNDAAILTMDGTGEWATSSIGIGEKIKLN